MKLMVGLGNPGRKYVGTRHNLGFQVLAEVARQFGIGKPRSRFNGETVEALIDGARTLLLCPHTLMNRSGNSVRLACDFYDIDCEDLLIVCDDLNLPLASLRFRVKGSSGGQKGLGDIIRHLGTEELARLRIGIDRPPDGRDPADFVLSRFNKEEAGVMQQAVDRAAEAAADWVRNGIDFCMNHYN